ncbi:MAG: DUF1015 domain-containing protein [Candidatus Rokubacteria bacterium]|nr:DUF1015 domain-containing protein [Candidatus Rokubacteria bacterium]
MRIQPFRGYRYGIGRVTDVSPVVAPPYDQISPAMQRQLHDMDPHNIVRLTLPLDGGDAYASARLVLERWVSTGAWQRDDAPSVYGYHQTYEVGGTRITRKGLIALGDVTEYARGEVLPHERTHAGPKRDRLALLEATGADIGLLFMLVGDPEGALARVIDPAGPPTAEARDLKGEHHRLWRITDAGTIAATAAHLAPRPVIIADGHHRYETAVDYARREPAARAKLMAFFPVEGPGLTIRPNHRLVHDVHVFDLDRFLGSASDWFEVAALDDPLGFRPRNDHLAVVAGARAASLTLKPGAAARIAWPRATSPAWRALAVSVLHEGLLRPLLDITDAKLDAKTHVDYTADQAEAVALARAGKCQAAFLIAPTTPAELQAVVRGGELMPQKSTHFYPKLLDGLVFHRLGDPA